MYLPPGRYLVSGTLPLYFYTFLTASSECRATLVLKNNSMKNGYVVDADVGDEGGDHDNECVWA